MEEIEKDALVTGLYETNMERLDLNIRVLTEAIQEQIQYYIYYETTNMEGCGWESARMWRVPSRRSQ